MFKYTVTALIPGTHIMEGYHTNDLKFAKRFAKRLSMWTLDAYVIKYCQEPNINTMYDKDIIARYQEGHKI